MSDKGRMDDLASLFLPDLLHPLTGEGTTGKNDTPFLWNERRSNNLTPLSSGLGMFMALCDERDEQPAHQVAQNGQVYAQQMPYGYGSYGSHFYLQFPESDFSHTLHYADFIPAEAGVQPLLRHRHGMLPVQPAFSPSTVIGQFESMEWPEIGIPKYATPTPSRAHKHKKAQRMQLPEKSGTQANSANTVNIANITAEDIVNRRKDRKDKKDPRARKETPRMQQVHIDFSAEALARLLELKLRGTAAVVSDASGRPVTTRFSASLDGRLFTNDQDNYNHSCMNGTLPPAGSIVAPHVISCYRRNFMLMQLKVKVGKFQGPLFVQGKPVQRLRIDVGAETEGVERMRTQSPEFLIVKDKERGKDRARAPGHAGIDILDKSTVVDVAQGDSHFIIRKLQFRNATSNSSNIQYQTYYRLTAQLVAETPQGDRVLHDLVSACTTVRGRNPSFYEDRNDVRINRAIDLKDRTVKLESLDNIIKEEDVDGVLYVVADEPNEGVLSAPDAGPEAMDDVDANTEPSESDSGNEDVTAHTTTNVEELIAAKTSNGDSNYHYFPILSVYYLPPINVVYFPHGAHQANTTESNATREDSKSLSPAITGVEKKRTSKVYFR